METHINKPFFTEENHSYYNPVMKEYFVSVTTLLHKYQPSKDWDKIAQAYIDKRTKEEIILDLMTKQSKSREDILQIIDNRELNITTMKAIWKNYSAERCDVGTKEHLRRELFDKSQTSFITKHGNIIPLGIDATNIENLYDLPDGRYCELLVWNNKLKVAGQSDVVIIETINGVRCVSIEDYKTNKQLIDYSYINKRTNQKVINEYLLPPFQSHCNSNYWLYQLQLNIYGWLLAQVGFKFIGGKIIHTQDGDKEYKLLNLQAEVKQAFDSWKIAA